jgi:hypothetical protein
LDRLLKLVRRIYPDWQGFEHPEFNAEEVAYKQQTVAYVREVLGRDTLTHLLTTDNLDEFLNYVEAACKHNNLLYRNAPRSGDYAILYADGLEKRPFCGALFDLLHGEGDSPGRLERYLAYVREHRLPNRWAFSTYLLFFSDPENDYFVKPTATRWFLELMGAKDLYSPSPSGEAYISILGLVKQIRAELGQFGVRDMIDVQSFLFVAHSVPIPHPEPDRQRLWKIAPGESGWQWKECLEGGFIGIGWEELGDISQMNRDEFVLRRDELVAKYDDWTTDGAEQVWKFAHILPGDKIVANEGTRKILGIGTVSGPYYYVPDVRYGHRLPITWDDTTSRKVEKLGWRRTLIELDAAEFQELVNPVNGTHPPYPLPECAAATGFHEDDLARWVRAIHRKKQAILYGPPGTGKTHIARHLTRHLIGGGTGFEELVQFHPSYSYEEFIQGIRPEPMPGGGLDYPLKKGRFLDFCDRAREAGDSPCVLIIDEINRAHLSRVFGELMYLLEYRDHSIPLAAGRAFSIPDNVYILGTMNTADRSIALVDHALRRRFAFIGVRPNMEILRHKHNGSEWVEPLIQILSEVNQEIANPHYEVGVTFFLGDQVRSQIEDIWQMEIYPYLEEYFFDQPSRAEKFSWDNIRTRLGS